MNFLFDAYPAKDDLTVQNVMLRYLDAVDLDFRQTPAFAFLRDKMKTEVSLPDSLFSNGRVVENPIEFNWQASFQNNNPGGVITLRFASGQRNDHPALVWETRVQTNRDRLPQLPEHFSDWLSNAHELTDDWFFKLIDGDLLESFK